MKRFLCLILCLSFAVLTFTACSVDEGEGHTLYVRDEYKHDNITATFKSSDSGNTLEIKMKKIDTTDDYTEFSCKADTALYDRVILTYDDASTEELSFNDYVSGWALDAHHFTPYTYGVESAEPEYKRVSFDYEERTKDILIWTPSDYDASSEGKYSVIYMTDGQNLFQPSATSTGSWGVAESALSCMAQSDNKFIIVGIENADGWRDNELTPHIGTVTDEEFENGEGAYFSDFVVDTVMPYIKENYNVYTDREHTSVCGSSSGGIESFYIAMEHPECFGSVGAFSPAFLLYSDDTWVDYLSQKDFSAGYPIIYLYCGDNSADDLEKSLCDCTKTMSDNLKKIDYPEDKLTIKIYDNAAHKEMYWRAVFPDYLHYAFLKPKI